ncbi:MAG: type II secretion system protein [Magnetococcales bacterium]|nr:type II secretion system protein [Magnetococcales bacterium]
MWLKESLGFFLWGRIFPGTDLTRGKKLQPENRHRGAGFTLVELTMVIVLLGILSTHAVPKFVDLRDEAERAALLGVAGGLGSGSYINLVACIVGNQACVRVSDCVDAEQLLELEMPKNYSVSPQPVGFREVVKCTLNYTPSGKTEVFYVSGT